jgi:hypothetical protein
VRKGTTESCIEAYVKATALLMVVLSVDLASADYADIGVVCLTRLPEGILLTPIGLGSVGLRGRPDPETLAAFLAEMADQLDASAIGLDGPQGWKHGDNGCAHSRECEARLHTQGKTGLPGVTKPANYLGFIQFSIATFDALQGRGWGRLGSHEAQAARVAAETFPTSAWRAVGLPPLPGKSRTRPEDLLTWRGLLLGLGPMQVAGELSHDELQAAVSGLGVLALAEGSTDRYEAVGHPPIWDGTHWLEGFIVNPRRSVLAV